MSAAPFVGHRLVLQISTAILARLVINTSRRFPYTFALALSRGLGVPLPAVTSLIAINQATGVLSPVFGPLGDRWGYRPMMLIAVSVLAVGMLIGGLWSVYAAVLLALFAAGLSKSIFDPALQSYLGERVPYQRRGLVIGMIEFSWAGSSLVGIPLVGLLIERWGWQSPFLVLSGLGLLGIIALRSFIPGDSRRAPHIGDALSIRGGWQQLVGHRAAWGALGFTFLFAAANDNLFVVYGVWLEAAFGLSIVALGAATMVIGVAELLGEGLTASIADRVGLKRALLIGLTLSALGYAVLPLVARNLTLALAGLFVIFLVFEFAVVTSLSLFTEVMPGARATMMSSNVAAMSIGRVIGASIGGPIWLAGGLLAIGLVSAAICGVALAWLLWGLHDWRAH